jgi:DNA-binding transcriptional LysR family regulator
MVPPRDHRVQRIVLIPPIDLIDDQGMETRLLEQFVTVADEGNVTRAAGRLFAAQSTVSAGIRSLERELGGSLFDRTSRRLELTPLGEALLPDARAALAAVDRMRDRASTSDAMLRGRVRLGIFSSMDIVDLTQVLGSFHERHPLVDIELSTSPAGATGLVGDVRARRLDLAFSGLPQVPPDIEVAPIRAFPFRVFVSPRHPLAAREPGPVSLAELAEEPFVETARGFANRVILDSALAERGLRRRVVAEMNDLPSVVRFAAAGIGIAVTPDFGHRFGAVVLDLADDVQPLRIGLASRSDAQPNRATAALAREVLAAAR